MIPGKAYVSRPLTVTRRLVVPGCPPQSWRSSSTACSRRRSSCIRIWSIPLLLASGRSAKVGCVTTSGALTRNRRFATGLPCSRPGSYHQNRTNRPEGRARPPAPCVGVWPGLRLVAARPRGGCPAIDRQHQQDEKICAGQRESLERCQSTNLNEAARPYTRSSSGWAGIPGLVSDSLPGWIARSVPFFRTRLRRLTRLPLTCEGRCGAEVVQGHLDARVGRVSNEGEFIPRLGFGDQSDSLDRRRPGP